MELTQILLYITIFLALYFQIFMLLILFENKKRNKTKINKDFFPSVSIIVPCWNEVTTIEGTLKSLLELDYPKDKLKIYVVDDGSTDGTGDKVKEFLPHPQIELMQKENGGKHSALNLALKKIDTELVAALDADSFVAKDALRYMVSPFANPEVASIASTIKITQTKNFWGIIQRADYFMIAFLRKVFAHIGSIFITPGPFSFYRTQVIKKIGGWRKAHNTEDIEIGIRLQSQNYIIENVESAEVFTKPMTSFKALYKQRLRWSYGFLKNAWDYRYMFFNSKYGNLGMFGMPSFLFSNIVAIFVYFLTLWILIKHFLDWVMKVSITGIDWPSFNLNWFFWDTGGLAILSVILTFLVIWSVTMGRVLTNEKKYFNWDILLYLVVYMLIAPLWVIGALLKVIFSIEHKWEDN